MKTMGLGTCQGHFSSAFHSPDKQHVPRQSQAGAGTPNPRNRAAPGRQEGRRRQRRLIPPTACDYNSPKNFMSGLQALSLPSCDSSGLKPAALFPRQ